MRITYVSPSAGLGGAERVLLSMLSAGAQALPEFAPAVVLCENGPLAEQACALGAEVAVVPMPEELATLGDSGAGGKGGGALTLLLRSGRAGLAARAYAKKIRATVADFKPDLIHSNGIKTHLLSGLAPVKGAPLIWHIHDFLGARNLTKRMLAWTSKGVSAAIAVSNAVAEDTRRVLSKAPVDTILNAVDLSRFSPGVGNGARLDALAGLKTLPNGVLRVGLVASYANWKGQDVFLKAAAHVLARNSGLSVRFYVIGGPIYRTHGSQFSRQQLERLGQELGLGSRLGFVDFQEDTAQVYRALDVVVHASVRPEPFGLTVAEAMACGRAVIVSKAGGAAELFHDGVDAIGMAPGNAEALSQAIQVLADDAALRAKLSVQARKSAEKQFSMERFGAQVAALYGRCTRDSKCG